MKKLIAEARRCAPGDDPTELAIMVHQLADALEAALVEPTRVIQVRAEARQELIDELVAIGLHENDEWDAVERVLPGVLRVIGLADE